MSHLVQARLVNDPFSDPGLFVDFRFGRRALLFDLGDLAPLSPRELARVTHAFVSHAHMDHFAGFDRLLRICLHREAPLHLAGPEGFADRVEHKLRAYTWNLLGEDSPDFVLTVTEWSTTGAGRSCDFRAREAFRRNEREAAPPQELLDPILLLDEEEFSIRAAVLDHGTPCLAFALEEKLRINVWREGLDALSLPVGRWLNAAKQAVRRGAPDDTAIDVEGGRSVTLGALKQHALRLARGQKLAYVVDARHTPENVARIVALAQGADQLFIETAFLQCDADIAAARGHLTATQAGEIARLAGAARIEPLHFSTRYVDGEAELRQEAEAAFRAAAPPQAAKPGPADVELGTADGR
jgi:ribonuclease Z